MVSGKWANPAHYGSQAGYPSGPFTIYYLPFTEQPFTTYVFAIEKSFRFIGTPRTTFS